MKILAFTDTHGNREAEKIIEKKAKKADIIVCCGDFTVFGGNVQQKLRWMNRLGKKVIFVHGNHENNVDFTLVKDLENVEYIHKSTYDAGEVVFIGYGGDGFSSKDPEFDRFAKSLILPDDRKLIFISHQPPYKTKLDYIWDHHGNKSYRKFLDKVQPVLALSGHLHENEGKIDKIKKTYVANPGPNGKFISV